jgi:NADH-quinone oxidoreductase subunit I
LVFDGNDPMAGLRCVACQICEKECPPKCIYIEKSKDKKPDYIGKPQLYPATFDIDLSVCMSCQICVEVCPFDAIKMDTNFELSTSDRFGGLLVDKHQLAKSNNYYRKIHPTESTEVDERLAAEKVKAEAKAKADAEAKAKAAAEAKAKAAAAPAAPPTPPAPAK